MNNLDIISQQARQDLADRDAAREKMLPLCREVIRCSGNAIRAVHRQAYKTAGELLISAQTHLTGAVKAVEAFTELSSTGAVRDAQKEYAEANITLAIVMGKPLPSPHELNIDTAAYLNGMAEAASEIRRYMLDSMRKGDLSRGEELLTVMDDIYSVLVTIDFPDAITGGLRRTTDMLRGVLERTRSDLTLAMQQKALETRLTGIKRWETPPSEHPTEERITEETSSTRIEETTTEETSSTHSEEQVLNSAEQVIYNMLSAWRTRKSTEENVAPFIIARNSTLIEIIKLRPNIPRDLMAVKGFGERRVNKYGKEIIAVIHGELIF
jgi:translin